MPGRYISVKVARRGSGENAIKMLRMRKASAKVRHMRVGHKAFACDVINEMKKAMLASKFKMGNSSRIASSTLMA